MLRRGSALLAALLVALALAACAQREETRVADRGIGGTGVSPGIAQGDEKDAGGIGGTGMTAEDRGIGGTGIFGTITGFGSILVNGLTVDFEPGVPIATNLGSGSSDDLRVGQLVAIEAEERSGRLAARSIEIQHAVSGPVSRVDAARGEIEVLGQIVRRPAEATIRDDGDLGLSGLRPGDWVEVSGLRDAEGAIQASRIDARPAGGLASLRGTVTETGTQNTVPNAIK